jgi:hypothetical protein
VVRRLGGSILLVFALWLVIGSFGSARASPVGCLETRIDLADDFFDAESTVWVGANGEAIVPDPGLGDPLPDSAGDAIDRAGNPTDDPDALCAAILKLIEPDAPALEALGFVDTANFEVVLPEEPSREFADATHLVAVVVEFAGPFPGSTAGIAQFGISFDSALYPNYSGPALELIGRDTTLDVYLDNGQWTLGRTEYRNGAFDFTANSNQFGAIVGDGRATIVFPESAVPERVGSIGFFAVSGNGVDVGDIGPFDPDSLLFVARAGAVSAPAPTRSAAAGTTSPAPTPNPSATPASGAGDLGWLLPAGLAGLVLVGGGVAAFALLSRRRGAETVPIGEVAAAVIATDVAMTSLAGRPGKGG